MKLNSLRFTAVLPICDPYPSTKSVITLQSLVIDEPNFTLATAKERGNARGDVNKTNSNPNLYLILGTSGVFRVHVSVHAANGYYSVSVE